MKQYEDSGNELHVLLNNAGIQVWHCLGKPLILPLRMGTFTPVLCLVPMPAALQCAACRACAPIHHTRCMLRFLQAPTGQRGDKTVDGFEITLGINYYGPLYLTELLIPILKRSSAPKTITKRIVWVTSLGSQIVNPPVVGSGADGWGVNLVPWDDLRCGLHAACMCVPRWRACARAHTSNLRGPMGAPCMPRECTCDIAQGIDFTACCSSCSAEYVIPHCRGLRREDSDWWQYARSKLYNLMAMREEVRMQAWIRLYQHPSQVETMRVSISLGCPENESLLCGRPRAWALRAAPGVLHGGLSGHYVGRHVIRHAPPQARRLGGEGIDVLGAHPGLAVTDHFGKARALQQQQPPQLLPAGCSLLEMTRHRGGLLRGGLGAQCTRTEMAAMPMRSANDLTAASALWDATGRRARLACPGGELSTGARESLPPRAGGHGAQAGQLAGRDLRQQPPGTVRRTGRHLPAVRVRLARRQWCCTASPAHLRLG